MRKLSIVAVIVLAAAAIMGCGGGKTAPGDAGPDASVDSGYDSGTFEDASPDVPEDDAGTDAGADAADAAEPADATVDSGTDAGADAGEDAAVDAGVDAGIDAGIDAGHDAGWQCSTDPDCDPGWRCNLATHQCEAASIIDIVIPADHVLTYPGVSYGETVKKYVVIRNKGAKPLNLTQMTTSMDMPEDDPAFIITAGGDPVTVPVGSTHQIEVSYTQNTSKAQSGVLSIKSNDTMYPVVDLKLQSTYTGTPKFKVLDRSVVPPKTLYPIAGSTTEYSIDFGTLVKGASVTITRTLGNGAKATDSNILEIAYPAVVGPANAKFTYKFNTVEGTPVEIPPEDFPVHLNVGKMIDMVITFTEFPREIADLATFHIVTNDPDINMGGGGSTLTLTLNAKAALPVIDVTPAQVDIGNCKIGTTCTETVTICNKGADVLSVSDLSGFVKKTEGFSTDPVNLVRTLAIGDCFTVKGNFNNAAVGLWNDVLNILSDDTVRSPLEVPFAAEAVDPQLTVTVAPSEPQHPLTMDFENVYTGEPHDPGIVMVENGGAGTLTVSAVTMDPSSSTDYSVKDYRKNGAPISGCPVDLTGTDILDFKVGLAPSVTGWIKGALTIASNGVGTPNVDVNLQAYGWNRDGKSCSSADQCESGFCINSRCCAEDCATSAGGKDIECWRCDVPGHEGTCTDAQPGLTCKDPFCADHETLHQKNSCDGAGLCKEGSEQDCTPFACASGACNSTCTTHGQCADMYSCCLGTCIDRFTPENQCQGALYLGTGGGETYCNLLCNTEGSFEPINTVTGKKSKWFKAEIQNCTKCTVTLNHQIKFRVPAGIIYQIRTFWGCGGTAIDTFRVTNTEKVFKISKPRGTTEKGDKFNYWIQIEYVEGASCEDWRLEVDKSECGSGC